MRILHVTPFHEPFWAYGGMARASAALCRALAARGHDVTVATALLDEGVPLRATDGGVRVLRFPGPRALARRLFPIARGLGRFLRAEARSFDVVHLHGHRNGLAVTASRACASQRRSFLLAAGWAAEHGFRGVCLGNSVIYGPKRFGELEYNAPSFEPMWSLLAETGLVVTFHVSTGRDPRAVGGNGGAIVNYVCHSMETTLEPGLPPPPGHW